MLYPLASFTMTQATIDAFIMYNVSYAMLAICKMITTQYVIATYLLTVSSLPFHANSYL